MPALFTDRRGGNSLAPFESFNLASHVGDELEKVQANRMELAAMCGPVTFMNQVHGDDFELISAPLSSDLTCDGLITTTPGVALAVLTADCIPLLLHAQGVVAAVHVGRAGLVNKIAMKVIAQMRLLGADAIHAQLGPSICAQCYEVPDSLADQVLKSHPDAFALTRESTSALDLPRALIADLVREGLTYEASPICTREDSRYFSYRRHNITGRQAGVIWL